MVLYDFEGEDGQSETLAYPMGASPPIGATITHEGRRLTRVASRMQAPIVRASVAHVSRILPTWQPGASAYTKEGYAIIESQADIDRIEKANPGMHWSRDVFDEPEANAQGND